MPDLEYLKGVYENLDHAYGKNGVVSKGVLNSSFEYFSEKMQVSSYAHTVYDNLDYAYGRNGKVAKGSLNSDFDTFWQKAGKPAKQPLEVFSGGASALNMGGNLMEEGTYIPPTFKDAAKKDKEENSSYLGAMWNNVVSSVERLGGGLARLESNMPLSVEGVARKVSRMGLPSEIRNEMNRKDEAEAVAAVKGAVSKLRTSSSSRENEKQIAESFDVTDGIGLKDIKALPAIATGMLADIGLAVPTAGATFFVQGYDDALTELDNMPESANMSEGARQAFGLTGAVVMGALDKVGLDVGILKNTGATRWLASKIIRETTEEFVSKGVKATAEQFEKAVLKKATSAASKIVRGGSAVAKGLLVEGGTEAGQEMIMDASRLAINALEDNEIFDKKEMAQTAAKRYKNAAVVGGILGGIAAGATHPFKNIDGYVSEQLAKAKTPEQVETIVKEIDKNIEDGTISKDDAAEIKPIVEGLAKQKVDEIKNGVVVIRPEEMNKPEVTTIAPNEATPSEEKAGVSIILPETNKEPNIVPLNAPTTETTTIEEKPTQGEAAVLPSSENKGGDSGEASNSKVPSVYVDENFVRQPTNTPPPKSTVKVTTSDGNTVGVTHAAMDRLAEEFGMDDRYEKQPETIEGWDAEAGERIKKGEMPKLIAKVEKTRGKDVSAVEQRMILQYVAGLKAEFDATGSKVAYNEFKKIKKLNDLIGKEWGQRGIARQGEMLAHPLDGGLASAMVAKEEANGGELTEEQQKQVKELYKADLDAKNARIAALEEVEQKYNEFLAQQEVEATKAQTKKTPAAKKKSKADFTKERKDIVASIKEKWSQASKDNTLTAVPVPYAKQLVAIAPDVAKLVRSLVEEGVTELADVIKNVHAAVKEAIPEIQETDVRDIIAGEYREKKETRNEISAKVFELQQESKLLKEYERVLANEPKTEKGKVVQNQKLKDLRDKIKTVVDERDRITRLKEELKRIQEGREKEPSKNKQREISDKEKELREEIRKAENINKLQTELLRIKHEIPKANTPKAKRELSAQENELIEKIKEESGVKALEAELKRLRERKQKAPSAEKRELSVRENELLDSIKEERQKWSKEGEMQRQIQAVIKANERAAAKYQERIRTGDFESKKKVPFSQNAEFKKQHPDLFNKAMNAITEKDKARLDWEIAMHKDEMKRWSAGKKAGSKLTKIVRTLQSIKAGLDDSFMFVQAGFTMITNPRAGKVAFKEHFFDFLGVDKWDEVNSWEKLKRNLMSADRFERGLAEIHTTDALLGNVMTNSGLVILEPQNLSAKSKEEMFAPSYLDDKIKVGGKTITVGQYVTKPFERAYTSLGNHLRVSLFLQKMHEFELQGKTFENSEQEYKDMALVINNLTGRGSFYSGIEHMATNPLTTFFIWSPRLIASGVNLLGVTDLLRPIGVKGGFYSKLTPEAKLFARDQMRLGIGVGLLIMLGVKAGALAAGKGDEVEVDLDPRSTLFGTVKLGDHTWNVWGRYTSIAKLVVQLASGQRKTQKGVEDLSDKGGNSRGSALGSFVRGKATPTFGEVFDWAQGEEFYTGKPKKLADIPKNLILPMSLDGVADGVRKDGFVSLLKFPLTFTGLSIRDDRQFYENRFNDTKEGRFLADKKVKMPEIGRTVKRPIDDKHPDGKMDDDDFDKFKEAKDKILLADIKGLMKGGWVVGGKHKEANDMTKEELEAAIKYISDNATDEAKEEVFGKVKVDKKTARKKRRDNSRNRKLLERSN